SVLRVLSGKIENIFAKSVNDFLSNAWQMEWAPSKLPDLKPVIVDLVNFISSAYQNAFVLLPFNIMMSAYKHCIIVVQETIKQTLLSHLLKHINIHALFALDQLLEAIEMIVAHQLQEGAQIGGYAYDEDEMQFSELRDLTRICLYDGYGRINKSVYIYSTIIFRLKLVLILEKYKDVGKMDELIHENTPNNKTQEE
ncbi:MAG: hypothetical protein EZS28_040298, partial [Streblomastix strix]